MSHPSSSEAVAREAEWQTLDPRSLLIGPLGAIKDFLVPMLMALLGATASDSFDWWFGLLAVVMPAIVGVWPWLTTRYRVTERNLEVRSRFIGTQLKTAPLDRIRTVDTESSVLHRLFGVTKVAIGTGTDDGKIGLNALDAQRAAALRDQLLHRARVAAASQPQSGASAAGASNGEAGAPDLGNPIDPTALPTPQATSMVIQPSEELAALDWRWARFAPFSLSRLVIAVTAIGALAQFGDRVPFWDLALGAWQQVSDVAIVALIVWSLGSALAAWIVVSVGGYLIQWFGFRLWRGEGSLHLTSGMFTTKSISIEEARVRGIILTEPLLLRLVRGAELSAMSTGSEHDTAAVLPPAPRSVAEGVATRVLRQAAPLEAKLTKHGWYSRRRCHVHAQWDTLIATAVFTAWWWFEWPVALPSGWIAVVAVAALALLGAVVAEATYRHRGFALTGSATDGYLVRGNGTTTRRRTALERDGVIGWVVEESIFQRRLGLCTLVATTAAGSERIEFTDLPREMALHLADRATPGLFDDFKAS